MDWIRRRPGPGRPPHPDVLTPAEWRVLEHVRQGRTNAEIAVRMGLSPNTVKTHVAPILAKTEMPDRHALRRWDGRPAETSRSALKHAFGLPLAELFTKGTAMMGMKLAVGGAVTAVFVGGLFAAFVFFAEAESDDEAFGERLAAPGIVAIIDGVDVTEEEWRVALALVACRSGGPGS